METLVNFHAAVVFTVVRETSIRVGRNLVVSLFLAVNLSRNVRSGLALWWVPRNELVPTDVLVIVSGESLEIESGECTGGLSTAGRRSLLRHRHHRLVVVVGIVRPLGYLHFVVVGVLGGSDALLA